jgi:hypothetical protein
MRKPPRIFAEARWMGLRDVDAVLAIERLVFDANAAAPRDVAHWLDGAGRYGIVAEQGRNVVGYLFALALKDRVRILSVAVQPVR